MQRFGEQQLFVSSSRVVISNICTAGSLSTEGARHRGCELNDNDEFRWMDLVFQKHRLTLAGDIKIIPALCGRNEHSDIQNMKNSSAAQPERFLPAQLQLAPLSRLQVGPPPSISLEDPFILSSHCTPATITPSPCHASHIRTALAKWRLLSVPSNE